MSSDLRQRGIRAISWSVVQEVFQRGLQFAFGVLLARLLGPEEFGTIAMLTVFITVAQVLADSGFGSALIQRPETSRLDESSVFYLNVGASLVLATLLTLLAPQIAAFYREPQLASILPVMTITLVINATASVQSSLMVRRLDFKKQTMITIASQAVSGVAGLAMAWKGFGAWSLVAQQLTAALLRAVLLWTLNTWRPLLQFSTDSLKTMFQFGSRMAGAVLLNTLFENLNSLIIGRLFAATELGYFNRAQSLQSTATRSLGTVTNRVTFPIFSRMQENPDRMRNGLRKGTICLSFVHFPIMAGLAASAPSLVPLLLTEKWIACVPYVQVLCFGGILYPLHILNLNVLTAMGHSNLILRLEIIKRALFILSILITYRWGVLAMLWGQVVQSALAYGINAYYTKRLARYSIAEQFKDFWNYLAVAGAMGAVVYFVGSFLTFGPAGQFAWQSVIGAGLYLFTSWLLKLEAVSELLGVIRRRKAAPASTPAA